MNHLEISVLLCALSNAIVTTIRCLVSAFCHCSIFSRTGGEGTSQSQELTSQVVPNAP